jgi:multicomponent Na+:H+ antiporter subunit E
MRRWPAVGIGLAALWLFVRGVTLPVSDIVGEALIGLAVGMPIAYMFRRFYVPDLALGARLRGVPYAVIYLLAFLRELLTANVDVAYRVLRPSMPIEPDVIEIPLRVERDVSITTIANSITLTPGTLTMDYDDERNALYVHAIAAGDREAIVSTIRTWEDYALRIFDEERNPGDPVPTVSGEGSAIDPDTAGADTDGDGPDGADTDEGGDADGE